VISIVQIVVPIALATALDYFCGLLVLSEGQVRMIDEPKAQEGSECEVREDLHRLPPV
jgi:hypothetical protein